MNDFQERLYEIAAEEVASKSCRPGLFAKAFADSEGDEKKTIARYIELRVCQLAHEATVAAASAFEAEHAAREAQCRAQGLFVDGDHLYVRLDGAEGTAFCLGCRRVVPRKDLYFCRELDTYYHEACFPIQR